MTTAVLLWIVMELAVIWLVCSLVILVAAGCLWPFGADDD
jgi:hypothetical protein